MKDLKLLSVMVQAFAVSTVKVSKGLGLSIKVDKGAIAPGIKSKTACAAALIGVIGEDFKGSVSLLIDNEAFNYIIKVMSGGMISNPSPDDPISMSALGELTNMICGSALQELSKSYSKHVDITPPQMFSGENLKSVPSESPDIKYYTIPMSCDPDGGRLYLVLGFR